MYQIAAREPTTPCPVIVTVVVSLVTQPKPVQELDGLVWGTAAEEPEPPPEERVWGRRPKVLGAIALSEELAEGGER